MSELGEMLDMVDVEDFMVYEGVDYKLTTGSSGPQINIKECPRCGGDKWKVFLNAETGLGNCFHGDCVDEKGYNLYTFAAALLGKSEAFQEIKRYVKELGWRPKRKKRLNVVAQSKVVLPPCEPITESDAAYEYLIKRGFNQDIIDRFGWMYCEKGKWSYLHPDGYWREQTYDGRIIIPVFDREGYLVTFQGRDITGQATKRYIFPPGLKASGACLYNGNEVVGLKEVVIVEGIFGLAAAAVALEEDPQLRDVGVISTFGKSLSKGDPGGGQDQIGHLHWLKERGLKKITMMWDGEVKTLLSALKAAQALRGHGFEVYIAELPADTDPNDVAPGVVRDAYRKAEKVTQLSANQMMMKWEFRSQ